MQIDFGPVKNMVWVEVITNTRDKTPGIFADRVWDCIWRQITNPVRDHILDEIDDWELK